VKLTEESRRMPESAGAEWSTRLRADRVRGTTPEVLWQLQAAAGQFTGQDTERNAITDQAGTGDTVVISAIDGMSGIGKTAVAVHAAQLSCPERIGASTS
jgi:hypothetical protein